MKRQQTPFLINGLRTFGPAKSGFSLVEVIMAVGIVAISVLTVVGLLPHGLEVSRKTADLAYKTRIYQQIVSEYQAMPWSVVTGAAATTAPRVFDYQGLPMGTGGGSSLVGFVATAEIVGTSVTLPSVGGSGTNDNLRTLTVKIATTGDAEFSFSDLSKSGSVSTYSSILARTH